MNRTVVGSSGLGRTPGRCVCTLATEYPMEANRIVVIENQRCVQRRDVVDHDVADDDEYCVDHASLLPGLVFLSRLPERRRCVPRARRWR